MIAFFCSTPYQILLSIHIKKTIYPNIESHIYINDYFADSKCLVERLQSLKVFSKVQLIKGEEFLNNWANKNSNIVSRILHKIYMTIRYKQFVYKFCEFENEVYDKLFLSFPDIIFKFAIKKLYDNNNGISIILFEDGTGGYTSSLFNELLGKPIIRRRLLHSLIKFKPIIKQFKNIMVFRPEMFVGKVDIPVLKIPPINFNDLDFIQIINSVFKYNEINKINERIIYLEQPLAHIKPELNLSMKKVVDEVLLEDYIVKLHPNSKSENYIHKKIYQFPSLPWEVICLNDNMNDKIIISYYSTAALTSKIIFDQEPTVIFLFKLDCINKIDMLNVKHVHFINMFIELYTDKTKIYVPENVAELKSILLSLAK